MTEKETKLLKVNKTKTITHIDINIGKKPENTNGLNQDQMNLYSLIWQRTVASQLKNSRYLRKTILIEDNDEKYLLRTGGRELIFDGFERVLKDDTDV